MPAVGQKKRGRGRPPKKHKNQIREEKESLSDDDHTEQKTNEEMDSLNDDDEDEADESPVQETKTASRRVRSRTRNREAAI